MKTLIPIEYFILSAIAILFLILIICLLLLSFISLKSKIKELKQDNNIMQYQLQKLAKNINVVGAVEVSK